MIVLHAVWTRGTLHIWGEGRLATGPGEGKNTSAPVDTPLLNHDELRRHVGDLWDSLLVSGAANAQLSLRLPHVGGRPLPSVGRHRPEAGPTVAPSTHGPVGLATRDVSTLAFSPADAIDLLTALPALPRSDVAAGASLLFWARCGELVLELLAAQRFVPAVHAGSGGRYRGYWRVVVSDQPTSQKLNALIAAMPPVCRSIAGERSPIQASTLVENFLWTAVDALVRRCLEGDDLAHAILERQDDAPPPQMRWLRSLVRTDPTLHGPPDVCRSIEEVVGRWLARLEPTDEQRSFRTCFKLMQRPAEQAARDQAQARGWRLEVHLQSTSDTSLTLDATALGTGPDDHPTILPRPFEDAEAIVREDIARAARHFPPLEACVDATGPLECDLTLEEAYGFLRDAAPVLEAEGFGVWVPTWWRRDRPRIRMHLDVRPIDSASPTDGGGMRLDALVSYDWRAALDDEEISMEEISRLAAAKQPLVKLRGRWIEVQPGEIDTGMQFLKKHRSGTMTLFEALRLSYVADDLETGLPVGHLRAHGWIDRLLNATDADLKAESIPQPERFVGSLRQYQQKGLEWLAFLARCGLGACLADDMGLGKTIQLIALLLHERESGDAPGPTLLVVPMSLVGNWHREIQRFGPSLRVMVHHGLERLTGRKFVEDAVNYDVVISTYGLTHRDFDHLSAVDWFRIALDEAQNIKNPAAKQAIAIRSLRAVHRVGLTGTPLENRLSELWSIMDFLNPGQLGTARDFRRRFAVPIERHHDADRAERLRHLIRPFVLRRLKDDPGILDELPAKLEMTVLCNLTREQAALYEALVNDMLGQIDSTGGIQRRGLILATLVKLKQICNHPLQFLDDDGALAHRSGKCERLTEMMEEVVAEGHRALIFTQFRVMGALLQRHLRDALGVEVLFLHGGTPQKERVRMVEQFQASKGQPDGPQFILSLKAGGFGLNLTAANHVFHYDRWWNPAVEDQATDRAHRIGQERQVQVHRFVCLGTLEERIAEMIERKRRLAEKIVGSGEEWITELSTEALRELFALSREAVADD